MTTPWLRQLWSSKSLRTSSYNSSLTPQLPMIVYKALLGQSGDDPLSIHRREREPDALPSTLRPKKPKSLRSGPLMQLSTWIGRASITPTSPFWEALPKSNHLVAPLGDRLSLLSPATSHSLQQLN
ncbi:hypothetical protein WN944_019912 [Citrus x changshan-huyou]|uniref:Uncharacterized protein n=1 Tax=Citrus x changshan-huyou TaxID=2935761 RepID=A0AAP0QGU4_9ROSI